VIVKSSVALNNPIKNSLLLLLSFLIFPFGIRAQIAEDVVLKTKLVKSLTIKEIEIINQSTFRQETRVIQMNMRNLDSAEILTYSSGYSSCKNIYNANGAFVSSVDTEYSPTSKTPQPFGFSGLRLCYVHGDSVFTIDMDEQKKIIRRTFEVNLPEKDGISDEKYFIDGELSGHWRRLVKKYADSTVVFDLLKNEKQVVTYRGDSSFYTNRNKKGKIIRSGYDVKDAHGNYIKQVNFDKRLRPQITTNEFVYDEFGNWTKKTEHHLPHFDTIYLRQIVYR
jgi:hypothetical protein